MCDAGAAGVISRAFGTPIGRLLLEGKITDTQGAAAMSFGQFIGYYDKIFGMLSRSARSPSYQVGRGGDGGPEYQPCGDCSGNCADRGCPIRERVSTERTELQEALDPSEWRVIYDAVILNEYPSWVHQRDLSRGLDRVAAFFNIGTRRTARAA
jgi:hypothetical protein